MKSMKLPDGMAFYGVLTTRIYCRPDCSSREPLRKNVRFYRTAAQAEADGLRACRRCKPNEVQHAPHADRIREACAYIAEHLEETITLDMLARRASMSRFHFQRTFKAMTGVTPKHYQEAARLKALKSALKSAGDITGAVYDAGYGSASSVYTRAGLALGMTPKQYRERGRGVAITYVSMATPLGLLMVGATDRGLCFVQFGENEHELFERLRGEYPDAKLEEMRQPASPEFVQWSEALKAHLAGSRPVLDLPLDVRATAFQMRVWLYLQKIPYGEVRSYSEVAAGIGKPNAARAVARACASNQVALVVPCHRVIRGTGALGGYRWGLERKRVLIDAERSVSRRRTPGHSDAIML